jgi:hypothetical protein
VRQLLLQQGYLQVETVRDYGDNERVTLGRLARDDDGRGRACPVQDTLCICYQASAPALIAGAVLMFILRFYWLQTGSTARARTLRLSGWLNGLVVLSGVLLCMVLDLNPLNNAIPWRKLTAILVVVSGHDGCAWPAVTASAGLPSWGLGWIFFIAKLAV